MLMYIYFFFINFLYFTSFLYIYKFSFDTLNSIYAKPQKN